MTVGRAARGGALPMTNWTIPTCKRMTGKQVGPAQTVWKGADGINERVRSI